MRLVMRWWRCLGVAGMALAGCTDPVEGPVVPGPLPRTETRYERMALFDEGGGVARLRGWDGALPVGATATVFDVESGSQMVQATADENGRIDVTFAAHTDQVFTVRPGVTNDLPLDFRARTRADAMRQMVRQRLAGTGSTPNQVVVDPNGPLTGDTPAYVVLSGDNALDNASMDDGARGPALVAFEETASPLGPLAATPWHAHVDGTLAWVSRYAQGTFSTVDLASGAVRATSSTLPLQTLAQPLSLDPPVDADGDGVEDTQTSVLLPRNPTGLTRVDNTLVVAFANVLSTNATGHSQYGPGMLAAFELDAQGRPQGTPRVVSLPWVNPQWVVAHPDGNAVVVSATGALHRDGGGWQVQSNGGVAVVALRDLTVTQQWDLGDFAPSKPLFVTEGHALMVPSVLRARLARMDITTGQLTHGPGAPQPALVLEDTQDLRSVFECALHATGLVACALFDKDTVVFVDPRTQEVNPWPFTGPVVIPENAGQVRLGLQSLAVRPGRNGVDRTGPDVVLLMSLASRLAALDTRFVFGP